MKILTRNKIPFLDTFIDWLKETWKKVLVVLGMIGIVGGAGLTADLSTNEISVDKMTTKFEQATQIKADYTLDGAILKKTDIKNAELDKYKGEPKDEVSITIGDNTPVAKSSLLGGKTETKEFKPDIELKRWNEVSFKLKTDKLLKDVATKDKTLSFEGDKVKFGTPKMSFEMFQSDAENYKYIWYLNEKPTSNIVQFQIESSGLDFFYQPPLTQEYQNGYSQEFGKEIVVSETQVKDLDGNVLVERPENVVGSYAVYHQTKGGMVDGNGKDYKTGKAFHIFRPHIIDANGAETWGILKIENGIYSVEIPQEFLDKAVYPIKSNDTFGYTSAGPSTVAGMYTYINGSLYSGAAGTGVNMGVFAKSSLGSFSANFQMAVYIHSTLNLLTNGTTNTESKSFTGSVTEYTINFSSSPTFTATDYILMGTADTNGVGAAYDTGATNQQHYQSVAWASRWPNPMVPSHYTGKLSIYATYTPGGGGGAVAPTPQAIIIE